MANSIDGARNNTGWNEVRSDKTPSNVQLLDINKTFSIDYSKRGIAKYNKCKKIISKDCLIIGKMVPFKDRHIVQYFHPICAFKQFRNARVSTNVISDISEIENFNSIKDEDKSIIIDLIRSGNAERTTTLPSSLQRKKTLPYSSPLGYIPQLASFKVPSIKVMYTNADQLTTAKKIELLKKIEIQKPLIIAICDVKSMNSNECNILDYEIPNYTLHPLYLYNKNGRGMALYSHT